MGSNDDRTPEGHPDVRTTGPLNDAKKELAEAALTEPLCVAYNALVVKSRIRPGDTVVVLGPGPIGLMATQIARVAGAAHIVHTLSIILCRRRHKGALCLRRR